MLFSKFAPKNVIFKLFGIPHTARSRKGIPVLYPATIIKNRPPSTIHKKIHPHFLRYSEYRIPSSFILLLNKGISTNKGINLTKNGAMIPDVLDRGYSYYDRGMKKYLPEKLWVDSHSSFLPQKHFDLSVATLIMTYSHSYFHWLFDVLPKIHLIEEMGLKVDKIYVKAKTKTQKESLQLLNYGEEKIIKASEFDIISAQKLIIPFLPKTDIKHPAIYKFLRQKYLKISNNGNNLKKHKRIYISRKYLKTRKVTNETAVIDLLKKFGFVSVEPERMSFLKQVHLFKNADIIISPHGSSPANIVFCKKGTKIIEIFNPYFVYPCFHIMSNQLGLKYHYMIGDGDTDINVSSNKEMDKHRYSEITVNLTRLKKTLNYVLKS